MPYVSEFPPAPRARRRAVPRSLCALLVALCFSAGYVHTAHAQPTTVQQSEVDRLSVALNDAQRDHLWRVAAWGSLNALGGLALMLGTQRSEQPGYWGFGAQSAAWGTVNIGIAAIGLLNTPEGGATSFAAALAAERNFHDILLLNMGLNVAYSSIGTVMVLASYQDVRNARAWRGHGTSLIMQGIGLFVLDGVALFASRSRLGSLLDMAGSISATALPSGIFVTVTF